MIRKIGHLIVRISHLEYQANNKNLLLYFIITYYFKNIANIGLCVLFI